MKMSFLDLFPSFPHYSFIILYSFYYYSYYLKVYNAGLIPLIPKPLLFILYWYYQLFSEFPCGEFLKVVKLPLYYCALNLSRHRGLSHVKETRFIFYFIFSLLLISFVKAANSYWQSPLRIFSFQLNFFSIFYQFLISIRRFRKIHFLE